MKRKEKICSLLPPRAGHKIMRVFFIYRFLHLDQTSEKNYLTIRVIGQWYKVLA